MKKSKNSDIKGSWSKVYVIEGEPTGCALMLEELKDTLQSKVVNVDDVESLKSLSKSFQFGKNGTIVLCKNPKQELLTAILEIANGTSARCSAIVAYYPGAYADKRTAFVSEANKRKQLYEFYYHLVNDPDFFKDYLSDWESRSGIKIAVKAKPWLITNAPTKKADVRGAKGAKEEIIYDIPSLESDLNKIAELAKCENRDILSDEDLKSGVYVSCIDSQWDYCDAFILGSDAVLKMTLPEQGYVGIVRMLASQCNFVAQIKSYGDKAINNSDEIANHIGGAEIHSKYPFLGGHSEGYKKIHPFRLKMSAKKFKNISLQRVLSLLELCNMATHDMLNGYSHELVYDMMLLASLNQIQYTKFSK